MIHLVIKGDLHAAYQAADDRKVELTSAVQRFPMKQAETFASAADADMPKIIKWYLEGNDTAPFPAGTLLLYTQERVAR